MTIRKESSSLLSETDKVPGGPPVRPPRRLPQGGPFRPPCKYSTDMADLAFWDVQFLRKLTQGRLTVNQVEKPPLTVLTIGCGLGLWTLNAAQQWPNSRFYGHDPFGATANMVHVLPLVNLSDRVFFTSWSLTDRLPYPDGFFDMVRVTYVSMGMSERQWLAVLEEILRVMKPGAWVEIIDDDLFFPGGTKSEGQLSQLSIPSQDAAPPPPSLSFITLTPTSASTLSFGGQTAHSGSTPTKFSSRDSYPFPTTLPPLDIQYEDDDPLDHSRLTSAWEEMLSSRDIPLQPTSVLPLYLSALAGDYLALPTLEIHMPDPSETEYQRHPYRGYFDMKVIDEAQVGTVGPQTIRDTLSTSFMASKDGLEEPARLLATNAPIHLARAVQTVRCCKEAIWEAYEALFTPEELLQPNIKSVKTVNDSAKVKAVKEHSIISLRDRTREAFDHDWFNWERDMMSRVGMRNLVQSSLGWEEPQGELPDWRIWRDRMMSSPSSSSVASLYGSPCPSPRWDVCRAVRGFVVWKGKASPDGAS